MNTKTTQQTIAYVYKWTELSTLKWYIGSRSAKGCHPDDGYICSSKIVKPLILANPTNWKREILCIGMPLDMRELEANYLKALDATKDPMSYNQTNGSIKFSTIGKKDSDETRSKKSNSRKGSKNPNYGKLGENSPNYKRICSDEEKEKHRICALGELNGMFGKKHSDETKNKMKEAHNNYSEESLANIKKGHESRIGIPTKPHSDETKNKLKEVAKRRPTVTCPYCNKTGSNNIMKRWHFDNCKLKA